MTHGSSCCRHLYIYNQKELKDPVGGPRVRSKDSLEQGCDPSLGSCLLNPARVGVPFLDSMLRKQETVVLMEQSGTWPVPFCAPFAKSHHLSSNHLLVTYYLPVSFLPLHWSYLGTCLGAPREQNLCVYHLAFPGLRPRPGIWNAS